MATKVSPIGDDEKPRLQADLGPANFMKLLNHGLPTATGSIADAFLAMYTFESACQIQLGAQAGGELVQVHPQIVSGVTEALRVQTGGMGGAFVWPSPIRKPERSAPGYDE